MSELCRGFKAVPAASLVDVFCPNENAVCVLSLPLGAVCRIAAHNADGERLRDVLCDCQELRHRFEGLTAIVLVETSYDHALPLVCQLLAHVDKVQLEKLSLVDSDDLRFSASLRYFRSIVYNLRDERLLAV